MNKFIAIFLGLLAIGKLSAGEVFEFDFRGLGIEKYSFTSFDDVKRYRTEYYESTCSRVVPVTRQICVNVPVYERVCTTVDGGIECKEVNGRRVCTTLPSTQECSNVQVGSRVECHNEVHRETQYYSCTLSREVPYYATVETKVDALVSFTGVDSAVLDFGMKITSGSHSSDPLILTVSQSDDIQTVVLFEKQYDKIEWLDDNHRVVSIKYNLNLIDINDYLSSIISGINDISFNKETKKLSFTTGKIHSMTELIGSIAIIHDENKMFESNFSKQNASFSEVANGVMVTIDLSKIIFAASLNSYQFVINTSVAHKGSILGKNNLDLVNQKAQATNSHEIKIDTVAGISFKKHLILTNASKLFDKSMELKDIRLEISKRFKSKGINVSIDNQSLKWENETFCFSMGASKIMSALELMEVGLELGMNLDVK